MQIATFLRSRKKPSTYVVIGLIAIWVFFHFFSHLFAPKKDHRVIVQATPAIAKNVPIEIQAPGSVESIQSVCITPQITGTINKIDFQPGQDVEAGQVLFEIDPASLNASLEQAKAILQRDKVELDQNIADANRYAELVKHEYVTRQQYEQTETVAKAQQALVDSDEAAVKQATIQLGYTKVIAPVAGKTGNVLLRVGDLVTANSSTPLVTINPLNPIWVDFSIPQMELPAILQNQKIASLTVNIFSEDGKKQITTGKLTFIDNNVNNQSGTVLLKASVDNANHALWPGEMVSADVVLSVVPNAITIPMTAVQVDQNGNYVFVAIKNAIHLQRIKLDRQQGDIAVVASGLKAGDDVLVTMPPNFTEKDKAKVQLLSGTSA